MAPKKEVKNGKKGGALSKPDREKIKQSIIDIIEEGNFHKYNKLELAKSKNITRPTLYSILEEIKQQIDITPAEISKVDIIKIYERLKKRCLYWWEKCENAGTEEESFFLEKQVMKEMREILKDYRETLIALGVIDKVADKLDIQADITQKQFIFNYNVPNGSRVRDAE